MTKPLLLPLSFFAMAAAFLFFFPPSVGCFGAQPCVERKGGGRDMYISSFHEPFFTYSVREKSSFEFLFLPIHVKKKLSFSSLGKFKRTCFVNYGK